MFLTVILLATLNLLTVKMFGETEFWFSMIKIVAILGLIVIGIVLILISYHSTKLVQQRLFQIYGNMAVSSLMVVWAFLLAFKLRFLLL